MNELLIPKESLRLFLLVKAIEFKTFLQNAQNANNKLLPITIKDRSLKTLESSLLSLEKVGKVLFLL